MSREGRNRSSVQRADGMAFSEREIRDLGVAWIVLSVAFAIFFADGGSGMASQFASAPLVVVRLFVVSLVTAGLGFMLHELAHKVVAVRFGQVAEFRANYQMLAIAVVGALAGIIFAAPGAVHHAGRITDREQGLVALAGPVTNVALGIVFVIPLLLGASGTGRIAELLWDVGFYGVVVNLLLAGFNMIPFGPLDGRTVLRWGVKAYALAAIVTVLPGLALAAAYFGLL